MTPLVFLAIMAAVVLVSGISIAFAERSAWRKLNRRYVDRRYLFH